MKRIVSLLIALWMLSCAYSMSACQSQPPTEEPPDQVEGEPPEVIPDEQPEESTETPTVEFVETAEEKLQRELENYNYMIGTQAFGPNYQFTDQSPLMELAGQIDAWGSNMIKFHATDDDMVDEILTAYDFDYVFMWYRSDPTFVDGYYSDFEAKLDYRAIYKYTQKLLTTYNGSGKTFYIGHWEGDWYYLSNLNVNQKDVSDEITNGMIAWLNNRQQAVDDAKRDTPHCNVEVWNYAEINRPVDALNDDYDRVVNRVLPYTNVDYVSYSAYDTMDTSAAKVAQVIDLIYANLPEKEGVPGPRVFVGEVAQPAANCDFDDARHCEVNLNILTKYLKCEVKHVLYWQMYCNETLSDGRSRGFWLIKEDGEQTLLYQKLSQLLADGKAYVEAFATENGRVPTEEEYRSFLLNHKILAER